MKHLYEIAPIYSYELIREQVEIAEKEKSLILIFGKTGYGKSIPLKHSVLDDDSYCYIDIRPTETTIPFFTRLSELYAYEGLKSKILSSNSPVDWLVQSSSIDLIETHKKQLLIVDEAGNFSANAQGALRQMWDNIKNQSGMVLAGPLAYRDKLKKWSKDPFSKVPELLSRVSKIITIEKPDFNDIKLICFKNDIDDKKIINRIFNKFKHLRQVRNAVDYYHDGKVDRIFKDAMWETISI